MNTRTATVRGLRVAELAAAVGLSADAIRFYEREGLLPAPERTAGGYRSYDAGAVERLRFIQGCQRLGLRLRGRASRLPPTAAGCHSGGDGCPGGSPLVLSGMLSGMTGKPDHPPVPSRDTAPSLPVISVMLIVPDATAAIAWYKDALGAIELWNLGGVAGLDINGAPFFLHEVNPGNPTETSPGQAGVTSIRIEVFADDPDRFIERAVAAGATAGPGIEDHRVPWGTHRQGGFSDPFGHNWSVGDKSPLRPFPARS